MSIEVRRISRDELDELKWNSCVHYAANGNVFGYLWFLDQVAKEWEALIEGDYESVLPLVYKKSFWSGKVLYQPELARALGIYSINVRSKPRIAAFLEAVPSTYKRGVIVGNEGMSPYSVGGFKAATRQNYFLALDQSYEEIREDYSPEVISGLQRADEAGLRADNNIRPERIAEFYDQHTAVSANQTFNFHALQRIMYQAMHRGRGTANSIISPDGELLAVNFLLFSHQTTTSLCLAVSPRGKALGAAYFMHDISFRLQAGKPLLFDFNVGLNGLFAKSMGAQPVPYPVFSR